MTEDINNSEAIDESKETNESDDAVEEELSLRELAHESCKDLRIEFSIDDKKYAFHSLRCFSPIDRVAEFDSSVGSDVSNNEYQALINLTKEGKEFYRNTSPKFKQRLFAKELANLDDIREQFQNGSHNSLDSLASAAMESMFETYASITGYDASWVAELYKQAVISVHSGRSNKYSPSETLANNLFIKLILDRGGKKDNSYKLLMRLRGDKAESEGHRITIRNSYTKFEKFTDKNIDKVRFLEDNLDKVAHFLFFEIGEQLYINKHKNYQKHIEIFEKLCGEILEYVYCSNFIDDRDIFNEWNEFKPESNIDKLFNNPFYANKYHAFELIDGWLNEAYCNILDNREFDEMDQVDQEEVEEVA